MRTNAGRTPGRRGRWTVRRAAVTAALALATAGVGVSVGLLAGLVVIGGPVAMVVATSGSGRQQAPHTGRTPRRAGH